MLLHRGKEAAAAIMSHTVTPAPPRCIAPVTIFRTHPMGKAVAQEKGTNEAEIDTLDNDEDIDVDEAVPEAA